MGTIKLFLVSTIDYDDFRTIIDEWKSKSSLVMEEKIISNDNSYLELINMVVNKRLQLKNYQNLFSIFLAKRIEDNIVVGISFIKKNIFLSVDKYDSNIKFFVSHHFQNKDYDLQILNLSISECIKGDFDEITLFLPNDNCKINELIKNYDCTFKKQLVTSEGVFNRFLLKI